MLIYIMRIDILAMHAPASQVWPPNAPLSIQALRGTRWEGTFDLDQVSQRFADLPLDSLMAGGLSQEHLDAILASGMRAFEERS